MPAGDRTGPMGMGPMTGRGTGYCGGYGAPGWGTAMGFRGGRGGGYGFRGRGGGFGRGFGRGWGGYNAPGWSPVAAGPVAWGPEQEGQVLRDRAELLQSELDAVRKRLNDLEAGTGAD